MIKNERQYRITRARADEMRAAVADLTAASIPEGLDPAMRELQLEALRGMLADLEGELAAFDALKHAELIPVSDIRDLPEALIRARIARGLTQRELAERLGVAEQQIQRYEASGYEGVSFSRLVGVAEALDTTVRSDIRLTPAS